MRCVRFAVALLCFASLPLFAADDRGEGALVPGTAAGVNVQDIIQKFAEKEKEFKQAREHYTYSQSVLVQTLSGDQPDGQYEQKADVIFDDRGRRVENVTYAPQNTLTRIMMTKEDMDDIEHRMPFVLTSDDLPDYQINFLGRQREDELQTYVFDMAPKHMEKGHRYFQGRIWVDQQDLQIVMTRGKSVPDIHHGSDENLFPEWTTYREQVDGHYWFPTYTRADDVLHFKSGDVPVREIVRYTNYKRFGSDVRITYGGEDISKAPDAQPRSQPAPQPHFAGSDPRH